MAATQPIVLGAAENTIRVGERNIKAFTYKPSSYAGGSLLLVIHGADRNADTYRDSAKTIADRFGFVVVSPELDKARYPNSAFQQGGMVYKGSLQRRADWTGNQIVALADAVRRSEGRADLPLYLIGHSAGAQLLDRIAAFMPTGATRIVIANPSSWVFPSTKHNFPYGFGGPTASLATEEGLRQYLMAPITVYVGEGDRGNKHLDEDGGAKAQGQNRYERALNFYKAGTDVAAQKGWPFAWRLVSVPGVGHDSKRMFSAPEIKLALGL